ncbi:MAG TPA: hypothetical protein CFH84_03285 [Sulfurimonas sp. UBA12504]|nr:MAG: hypothetical protein A2019_02100 [Sulfurimonas sp. GWF2_37_8]DAB30579.1 MAG TPA: hypothetical protein CFH84_03285 [Sulfurimonas sp. UBA12504]
MKKFNLFKEIIVVQKMDLLKAINTSKEFAITIAGEIKQEPYTPNDIFIFLGKYTASQSSILMPKAAPSIAEILGKNYQVVEDDDRVLIKAFSNWQELISVNLPRASYDDTTGDGVSEFSSSTMEDIGWNATEFSIKYRELVEVIEENCEGTLLCIEQENPYQFSGLGFIKDEENAVHVLYEHCQKRVKEIMLSDDAYALETLSDDELEAAEFFKLA